MEPAREPASSRPKPCASLKKPHESCSFAAPCGPCRKKMTVVRHQLFPQKSPGSSLWFLRTGVQPSPGSSTIELPSAFVESGAYPPDRALPDSPRTCSLPLACRHPPEGHQIGARNRRTPGNTILNQPHRRRVSTDRLNRDGSQLAASLEDEPGPTPAGMTLPHFFFFLSLISLIADGPHHYHPACGHKGSSHLFPVHALQLFIAIQVQHSYNSSTNG